MSETGNKKIKAGSWKSVAGLRPLTAALSLQPPAQSLSKFKTIPFVLLLLCGLFVPFLFSACHAGASSEGGTSVLRPPSSLASDLWPLTSVIALYGLPKIAEATHRSLLIPTILAAAGVSAVFVPSDRTTIAYYKKNGFQVFVAVNVFGGSAAWQKYPDSRPVMADGHLLGSTPASHGLSGVCPSHPEWRADRLAEIAALIADSTNIDGIWLDFIRYPGLWEAVEPSIPDTCYCARCIEKFQQESGVHLPARLDSLAAAAWIREHAPYEWMVWKKEQITSFVHRVRTALEKKSPDRPIKLGLFVVPWTKGERNNNISFLLGQDFFQLAQEADVLSPMLYHRLLGRSPAWASEMVDYYKETAPGEVWPIIQSSIGNDKITGAEFSQAVSAAAAADADGLLVFSFSGMAPELWPGLKQFQPPGNLIPNPDFAGSGSAAGPDGWQSGKAAREPGLAPSWFFALPSREISPSVSEPERLALGIFAGDDLQGYWQAPLPECEPEKEYLFTGQLFRDSWRNGVYPRISIWGQDFLVNTHLQTKTFQPVRLHLTCPAPDTDYPRRITFVNDTPGSTFWLRDPELRRQRPPTSGLSLASDLWPLTSVFPLGIYGAKETDLEVIKKMGLNTVLFGGSPGRVENMIKKCRSLGLRYMLTVPRDPDRLKVYLDRVALLVRPGEAAFYVNDEPGIHSFPGNAARDIQQLIKERFPWAKTYMAVVRPQVVRDYLEAADIFMLDQYPVPSMPMTWLSDSMDQAASQAGPERLASIIQAFGGPDSAADGWPRLPTFAEMDCLAFLSLIHGSRAVFFFSYARIGKSADGRARLGRVVARLNRLGDWLSVPNSDEKVLVRQEPSSPARPAIHCATKEREAEKMLTCVNTKNTPVTAKIGLTPKEPAIWRELFTGREYRPREKTIRVSFTPYGTKVLLGQSAE